MAKGVLGNDPFRRSAAPRPETTAKPAAAQPSAGDSANVPATPVEGAAARALTQPGKETTPVLAAPVRSSRAEQESRPSPPKSPSGTSRDTAAKGTEPSMKAPRGEAPSAKSTTKAAGKKAASEKKASRVEAAPATRQTVAEPALAGPSSRAESAPANKLADAKAATAKKRSRPASATAQGPSRGEVAPTADLRRAGEAPAAEALEASPIASAARETEPLAPSTGSRRDTRQHRPTSSALAPSDLRASAPVPSISTSLSGGNAANDLSGSEPLPPLESEAPSPPVDVPFAARALGAAALARDILVQALDRPGLKRMGDVLEGLMLAFRTGLGMSGGGNALDPFGKDPALLTRLEPLLDFLYERYWRVTVENAVALPPGPAILVANHAGALPLDGPVLALALSRERPDLQEPRWLVEDQIFYAPFWGALLNRLGAIRASPENALRLLEERRPVLVFPEGVQGTGKGYRERYRLKRFGRGGFVKLAIRTGAPIVPVAIVGAEETTPMLAKLPGKAFGLPYVPLTTPVPLPVRWAIRFGSPMHLKPEGDELAYVQQVTERTRSEIETMLQSLLRERAR